MHGAMSHHNPHYVTAICSTGYIGSSHNLAQDYRLEQTQRCHYDNCRNCGAPPHAPGTMCVYCGSTPTPLITNGGGQQNLGAPW